MSFPIEHTQDNMFVISNSKAGAMELQQDLQARATTHRATGAHRGCPRVPTAGVWRGLSSAAAGTGHRGEKRLASHVPRSLSLSSPPLPPAPTARSSSPISSRCSSPARRALGPNPPPTHYRSTLCHLRCSPFLLPPLSSRPLALRSHPCTADHLTHCTLTHPPRRIRPATHAARRLHPRPAGPTGDHRLPRRRVRGGAGGLRRGERARAGARAL